MQFHNKNQYPCAATIMIPLNTHFFLSFFFVWGTPKYIFWSRGIGIFKCSQVSQKIWPSLGCVYIYRGEYCHKAVNIKYNKLQLLRVSNFPDYGKTNCPKLYQLLILVCATSFLQNNRPRDKKVVIIYLQSEIDFY